MSRRLSDQVYEEKKGKKEKEEEKEKEMEEGVTRLLIENLLLRTSWHLSLMNGSSKCNSYFLSFLGIYKIKEIFHLFLSSLQLHGCVITFGIACLVLS